MKKGIIALSPIIVFVLFYLVTSIIAGDFYKIPITVAFMVSSIYAIIIFRDRPLLQRINSYSRGAATEQMMLMIWIFVLAGAFAHSAKSMGSIDATVNLALSFLPPSMIFAGMFLSACFISLSIGTRNYCCTYTDCSRISTRNRNGSCHDDCHHCWRFVFWR